MYRYEGRTHNSPWPIHRLRPVAGRILKEALIRHPERPMATSKRQGMDRVCSSGKRIQTPFRCITFDILPSLEDYGEMRSVLGWPRESYNARLFRQLKITEYTRGQTMMVITSHKFSDWVGD